MRRFYHECEPNTLKSLYTSFMRPLLEYAVPVYVIPILWRTLWPWSLFKDLLQKCVQRPGKMWTMMNSSVCSTCQIWKLGGIPQNSASYINELLNGLDLCLTLLLTTDVTSHILQSLTVTPFKFHLLIPQVISTWNPWLYGMNYRLRLSHLCLLPPLREHACMFLYSE